MKYLSAVATLLSLLSSTTMAVDYNATLSMQLLYYSAASFCSYYSLDDWTCGPACKADAGVGSVTIVEGLFMGTFGFVVYNNVTNSIVVSFRGSYTTFNWISDMDYFLTPFPEGPSGSDVHRGFYDAYQGLSY